MTAAMKRLRVDHGVYEIAPDGVANRLESGVAVLCFDVRHNVTTRPLHGSGVIRPHPPRVARLDTVAMHAEASALERVLFLPREVPAEAHNEL